MTKKIIGLVILIALLSAGYGWKSRYMDVPQSPENGSPVVLENGGRAVDLNTSFSPKNDAATIEEGDRKKPSSSTETQADDQAAFSVAELDSIRDFGRRYPGALDYSTEEQRQWLQENGYPSDADIAAASLMTTEELRDAANSNEVFAKIYFDSMLESALLERKMSLESGVSENDYLRSQDGFLRYSELRQYSDRMLQSDSPFGGYQLFRYHSEYTGKTDLALGSLVLIQQRGDRRVDSAYRRFQIENQISTEVRDAVEAYSIMMQTAYMQRIVPIPD